MDGHQDHNGNHISDYIDRSRFKKRPRYTVVLHNVRVKLGISVNTYMVADSVHKLSSTNSKFPYCVMSKEDIADFLGLGRATVFRSIKEGVDKRLIERTTKGFLRATEKWINAVEVYDINPKRR